MKFYVPFNDNAASNLTRVEREELRRLWSLEPGLTRDQKTRRNELERKCLRARSVRF